MPSSFFTVIKGGDAIIEVKRSKFIAAVRPVQCEQDALLFLNSEIRKYYDAKHHCSAEIIMKESGAGDLCHSSDDGEPSGTAGKPILEVLQGSGLKNVCCIVTRYFGGTLLGTGGLVRAYTEAARAAAEASDKVEMRRLQAIRCCFDYELTGKIQYALKEHGIIVTGTQYGADVSISCLMEEKAADGFCSLLMDISSGRVRIEKGGTDFHPVKNL